LLDLAALGGVVMTLAILWWGYSTGRFHFPGGDTILFYDVAGDRLRAGQNPYDLTRWGDSGETARFLYAPPWAVFFGAVSWLPPETLHVAAACAGVLALRSLGGSWRGAGILSLFPLVAFELSSGNINLLVAAAIALAARGHGAVPSIMAFAKLSPALALDRRGVRSFAATSGLLVALTIPWLWLWPAWLEALAANAAQPIGPLIPVPFTLRLVIGLALIATRLPSLRVAGAVIATPAFYYGSLVLLLALVPSVRDALKSRSQRRAAAASWPNLEAGEARPGSGAATLGEG
jgi:hypothetical protein